MLNRHKFERINLLIDDNDKSLGDIHLVQITDSHLFSSPDTCLGGMCTNESLEDVVALVNQQGPIDYVLCTGDLAQDASIEAYQRFEKIVSAISAPKLWLSGNHDNFDNIKTAIGHDNPCLNKSKIIGNWKIIMLNSTVEGVVYGRLSANELRFLDVELAVSQAAGQHVLVALHHNSIPVEAEWLQQHNLRNSQEFQAVLDKYTHVRCVLFGHIHHVLERERKGVLVLGSPSTCSQFHPLRRNFTLDDLGPGYRWLRLSPEGSVETGINRVEGKDYNVDLFSSGY